MTAGSIAWESRNWQSLRGLSTQLKGRIYRIHTYGNDCTQINYDHSYFINVTVEWIYFQNRSDGGKIYRISLDGSEKRK